MRRLFLLIVLLLISSPWLITLLYNLAFIYPYKPKLLIPPPQEIVDEINTLRGESSGASSAIFSRLLINKFTILTKEFAVRYLESYDPEYLFFNAGVDVLTKPQGSGHLYLTFLPLSLYSLYKSKKNKSMFYLLALSPIPSIIIFTHFDTISKIPLFLSLTILASEGLTQLLKNKKAIALLLTLILIFETIRFFHNFTVHYPSTFAAQIYSLKQ